MIYLDHGPVTTPRYENEKGKVWMSSHRRDDMCNLAINWYSGQNPQPNDCFLVLEPMCINPCDYNLNFLDKHKHIFAWCGKAFENTAISHKVTTINHPSWFQPPSAQNIINGWKPWNEKRNELVIIANNKTTNHISSLYELRSFIADLFHNKGFPVSWYGQIPISKPYYKGPAPDKHAILKEVKFSLCSENCYDPVYSWNYLSEKMPDVWYSGTVPLYMGCHNIDDYKFSPDSYIDLRKFVIKDGKKISVKMDSLYNEVINYNEDNFNNMTNAVKENLHNPEGLLKIISHESFFERIIDVLIGIK